MERGAMHRYRDATTVGRAVAAALAAATLVDVAGGDTLRPDNPLLVPEVALAVVLLAAALLPRHAARPALLPAFGCAVGVAGVAGSTGGQGRYALAGAAAVAAAALLVRELSRRADPAAEAPGGPPGWWRHRGTRLAVPAAAAAVTLPLLAATGTVLAVSPPVTPFTPAAWRPDPGFTVDDSLVDREAAAAVAPLLDTPVAGPEDLAVDDAGRVYTGTRTGEILRIDPDAGRVETFAAVGGRPLGLAFHPSGDLLVANHGRGLQAVAPDGEVTLLAGAAAGEPIRFANDLAVADDGVVYFSDSNSKYNNSTLGDAD